MYRIQVKRLTIIGNCLLKQESDVEYGVLNVGSDRFTLSDERAYKVGLVTVDWAIAILVCASNLPLMDEPVFIVICV